VVKEAAPLVVDDEQRTALVLRRLHEGMHNIGDEGLTDADVAVRVLVPGRPLILTVEGRIDEGQGGQRARGGLLIEILDLAGALQAGAAPQSRDRDVGVVVLVRHPDLGKELKIVVSGKPLPDGVELSTLP
jgi:hypothetical protein